MAFLDEFKKKNDPAFEKQKQEARQKEQLKQEQILLAKKQEEDERKAIIHAREVSLATCEKLNRYLEQQDILYSQQKHKDEIVHIDNNGFTFDSEGFTYNALVVPDTQGNSSLTVDYKGVSYSIQLKAGINVINALTGSRFKTNVANGLDVVLVKTNNKLA